MNFGEIVETAVAQVISLTQSDQLVNANPVFVERMVNKAYHKIEKRALWKFSEGEATINAVAGTRVCANVPADLSVPLAVYSDLTEQELAYHDERQRFWDKSTTGAVESYGLWNDEFRFYPLPKQNETFTLRYYKKWTDLADPSDTPVIPETFHDLLVDFASGQLALRLPPTGDRFLPNSKAQPYLDAFFSGLEEMSNSDLVMKTWDAVPNYDYTEHVLGIGEW
jgi:hypothetical protein